MSGNDSSYRSEDLSEFYMFTGKGGRRESFSGGQKCSTVVKSIGLPPK